jgi:hypothetical protein
VANSIRSVVAPEISCEYLHASRQSWHLPALLAYDRHASDWVLVDASQQSLRTILSRVEVRPEDIAADLAEFDLDQSTWETKLGSQVVQLRAVLQTKRVQSLLMQKAQARREAFLQYLKQTGLLAAGKIGIVDVGWHGRLQLSLSKVLHGISGTTTVPELCGFYLGLRSTPPELARDSVLSFLSTRTIPGAKDARLPENGTLLEIFFAATHGSVVRFVTGSSGAVPELRDALNHEALGWGLSTQQEAIMRAVELLKDVPKYLDLGLQDLAHLLVRPAVECLQLFANWPTKDEATTFGQYPHSVDQNHLIVWEMAPKMSAREIVNSRIKLQPTRPSAWPEGTLRRSLPQFTGTLGIRMQRAYKALTSFRAR